MHRSIAGKRPFMSLWLSAANSVGGSARSAWTAEMHRRQTAMMRETAGAMIRFWTGGWRLSPGGDRAAKRRRRDVAGGSEIKRR